MKKIVVGIIIILIIIAIGVIGYKVYDNSQSNVNQNNSNVSQSSSPVEINAKKLQGTDDVVINITGDPYLNELMIKEVLEESGIEGVELNINVKNDDYNGINGNDILTACSKALGIKIPEKDIVLANILISTSTGLDRLDSKQTVYNAIEDTNEYFAKHSSSQGLFMEVPNNILAKYSPKIQNNDGADSLFVQMCIFLNEYYNNLNHDPNYYETYDPNTPNGKEAIKQNVSTNNVAGNNVLQKTN
ncbi:MAG: hypothetical protein ACRC41_12375 [Sarcina sp.]